MSVRELRRGLDPLFIGLVQITMGGMAQRGSGAVSSHAVGHRRHRVAGCGRLTGSVLAVLLAAAPHGGDADAVTLARHPGHRPVSRLGAAR